VIIIFVNALLDSGEHCHDNEQQFKGDKIARRKLWIASVLCVIFMIAEAVGKEKVCSLIIWIN
jgi:Co/Zn/Cd efflux system component